MMETITKLVMEKIYALLRLLWDFDENYPPALTDELCEILYENDGIHLEKSIIRGIVTKIHEVHNFALINHEVFLDLGKPILGDRKLRLGDKVTVRVQRYLETDAWSVDHLESIQRETWDLPSETHLQPVIAENNIPQGFQTKQVVGQVTAVNQNKVTLNHGEVLFSSSKVNLTFELSVGDWLTVTICFDPEDHSVKPGCLLVKPLRQWKFEGFINALNSNDGIIDEEIFFSRPSCLNGYTPQINDRVHVTAIESSAGGPNLSWRAVHVTPKLQVKLGNMGNLKDSSRIDVLEEASAAHATTWIIKGERPFKPPPFVTNRLPFYVVPRFLWQAIRDSKDIVRLYPSLAEPLSPQNYRSRFAVLLHLEEIEMALRIGEYAISRTSLEPKGPFLSLTVEGLAEKRPSLVPGDSVILSNPWASKGPQYEGFIHETRKSEVFIKFDPEFHIKYSGEDFSVRFQFNRTPLRRCHFATESAAEYPGMNVLFPEKLPTRQLQFQVTAKKTIADRLFSKPGNGENSDSFKWFNQNLNQEQKNAVRRILTGEHRPVPYIIYGPPGTGKTVTVVEAILQVFHLCPQSRILVATPSNSSADLISERLEASQSLRIGDMVRLNAIHRNLDTVPDTVLPYCATSENLEKVVHHRIIVTTCTTAGTFYTISLRHGHFTHVFIDEAGQATEPEALVPIGLLRCDDKTPGQIVLAGDPQQLGPVLQSRYSTSYGLSLSLLERLSLHPLYARDEDKFADSGCYNPGLLTKLVRNYRSHKALLKLPSEMFYDGELVPCASEEVAGKLAHFPWLPLQGIPLIFCGVKGVNFQEADSPSWCNPSEVYNVVRYLQRLLNSGVDPGEIGIITPYRKQVEKIRKFIAANDLVPVKVGSVEEFQGQEKDVVIVSTVRSAESMVDKDVIHNLGFVRSPKRFNVTVTRARSLLIIVGNPHLLVRDKYWGPFLKYCIDLGVYTGCDFTYQQAV